MIQIVPLRLLISCCYSLSRQVVHISYTFCCVSPHTLYKQLIQIWGIWRPQLRCDEFGSFFL